MQSEITNSQAVLYIQEVYEEFKTHTLHSLTSYDLAKVDELMDNLMNLLTDD